MFKPRSSLAAILLLAAACAAQSNLPAINQAGVVNAASWSSPIAPGAVVAIFGTNLAAAEQSADAPWPLSLGGTSVTIGGVSAPVGFVSPTQVNAYVPSSVPASGTNITAVAVVVTTSAGPSAAAQIAFAAAAPGFFSADGSGCGQAAALNITPDGTVSFNSASNSAAPGDYVALFGTGFGLANQQPPDGVAASVASSLESRPTLFIDSNAVPSLSYAGLAPVLTGIDQIDFQVPASTRNGCFVPLSATGTFGSPTVTISVQSGRGQCTNPSVQSWGRISLNKSVFSGPGSIQPGEFFTASFPSGPGVQPPASQAIVYAPTYIANVIPQGAFAVLLPTQLVFLTCSVPGYVDLSAGAIQIQPQSGNAVTAQPLSVAVGGVTYNQTLPAGFIAPGAYTILGTQGNAVGLMANLTVGAPIQIQTAFPAGTAISSSKPLTVTWTGGDPGTLVEVSLIAGQGLMARESYSYVDATSGSLTISPVCSGNPPPAGNGVVCSFGLPPNSPLQISVEVLPAQPPNLGVPGITGPVQLTWQYSYNFSGLTLGP